MVAALLAALVLGQEPAPAPAPPVALYPRPVAHIDGPDMAVAGVMVKFTAVGSTGVGEGPQHRMWTVKPGGVQPEVDSSGESITFATPEPGTYSLMLAVSGPGGVDVKEKAFVLTEYRGAQQLPQVAAVRTQREAQGFDNFRVLAAQAYDKVDSIDRAAEAKQVLDAFQAGAGMLKNRGITSKGQLIRFVQDSIVRTVGEKQYPMWYQALLKPLGAALNSDRVDPRSLADVCEQVAQGLKERIPQ